MDKSEVIKIVKRELPRYKKLFNLPHWSFDIVYGWIGGSGALINGTIVADPNYNAATITINADLIESEEDLCRTLRHELLHVSHADFETFRKAIGPLVTRSEFESLDVLFEACCENTVKQLEFMMRGLEVPLVDPKVIARRAKQAKKKRKKK